MYVGTSTLNCLSHACEIKNRDGKSYGSYGYIRAFFLGCANLFTVLTQTQTKKRHVSAVTQQKRK